MKKIVALACAACLSVTMFGCGAAQDSGASADQIEQEQEAIQETSSSKSLSYDEEVAEFIKSDIVERALSQDTLDMMAKVHDGVQKNDLDEIGVAWSYFNALQNDAFTMEYPRSIKDLRNKLTAYVGDMFMYTTTSRTAVRDLLNGNTQKSNDELHQATEYLNKATESGKELVQAMKEASGK